MKLCTGIVPSCYYTLVWCTHIFLPGPELGTYFRDKGQEEIDASRQSGKLEGELIETMPEASPTVPVTEELRDFPHGLSCWHTCLFLPEAELLWLFEPLPLFAKAILRAPSGSLPLRYLLLAKSRDIRSSWQQLSPFTTDQITHSKWLSTQMSSWAIKPAHTYLLHSLFLPAWLKRIP